MLPTGSLSSRREVRKKKSPPKRTAPHFCVDFFCLAWVFFFFFFVRCFLWEIHRVESNRVESKCGRHGAGKDSTTSHLPTHPLLCSLQGSPVPQQGGGNGHGSAPAAGGAGASKKKKKKKKGCCAWVCPCCCSGSSSKKARVEPGDDSSDDDAEAAADAKAFVNQIKNLTGLWDNDPDEVREEAERDDVGDGIFLV